MTTLISNKVRDSKSQSVVDTDRYFICRIIDNKWHIIESAPNSFQAFKGRDILANHNFKHGHIKTKDDYRVFKKGLIPIVMEVTR